VKARSQETAVFELWDINADPWALFLALESAWRFLPAGMSVIWLGLDYGAVDVFMRRRAIEDADGKLFADLMILEDEAVAALSESAR
jgi:hypothetical protein